MIQKEPYFDHNLMTHTFKLVFDMYKIRFFSSIEKYKSDFLFNLTFHLPSPLKFSPKLDKNVLNSL